MTVILGIDVDADLEIGNRRVIVMEVMEVTIVIPWFLQPFALENTRDRGTATFHPMEY